MFFSSSGLNFWICRSFLKSIPFWLIALYMASLADQCNRRCFLFCWGSMYSC